MNENEWCAEFIYGAGADDFDDDAIENMVVVEFMCGFLSIYIYIVCGRSYMYVQCAKEDNNILRFLPSLYRFGMCRQGITHSHVLKQ